MSSLSQYVYETEKLNDVEDFEENSVLSCMLPRPLFLPRGFGHMRIVLVISYYECYRMPLRSSMIMLSLFCSTPFIVG
jgi:hypothetical protein